MALPLWPFIIAERRPPATAEKTRRNVKPQFETVAEEKFFQEIKRIILIG
jgi:hypothetical protein